MTVEQLIAVLQKMPHDAEVIMKIRLGTGAEHVRPLTSIVNVGEAVLLKYRHSELA